MNIIYDIINFLCALGIHDWDEKGICRRCGENEVDN
jgi:hypothetical protein